MSRNTDNHNDLTEIPPLTATAGAMDPAEPSGATGPAALARKQDRPRGAPKILRGLPEEEETGSAASASPAAAASAVGDETADHIQLPEDGSHGGGSRAGCDGSSDDPAAAPSTVETSEASQAWERAKSQVIAVADRLRQRAGSRAERMEALLQSLGKLTKGDLITIAAGRLAEHLCQADPMLYLEAMVTRFLEGDLLGATSSYPVICRVVMLLRPLVYREWGVQTVSDRLLADRALAEFQHSIRLASRHGVSDRPNRSAEKTETAKLLAAVALPQSQPEQLPWFSVLKDYAESGKHLDRYLRLVEQLCGSRRPRLVDEDLRQTPLPDAADVVQAIDPAGPSLAAWQRLMAPARLGPAHCLRLTLRELVNLGLLQLPAGRDRRLTWEDDEPGKVWGDVQIRSDLPPGGSLRLVMEYQVAGEQGEPQPHRQVLALVPAESGRGVALLCPACQQPIKELFCPPGSASFACQRCMGVGRKGRGSGGEPR